MCGFVSVFFGVVGGLRNRQAIYVDDISIKKCNICNVCEIESWIYHIYRGGDPREESGGIIGVRHP